MFKDWNLSLECFDLLPSRVLTVMDLLNLPVPMRLKPAIWIS